MPGRVASRPKWNPAPPKRVYCSSDAMAEELLEWVGMRMSAAWAEPARRPAAATDEVDDGDRALVRAMARGETAALERLYARHGPGLLAFLVGRLRDRPLAEEVLQDVMLAAWRAAAGFRGESGVRTWLLVIARNRAINARRRARVATVDLDTGLAVEARKVARERRLDERLDLREALATLPEDQRLTLELVFFHGLAVAEAAEVLDVAPGTVKSRLHRARRALRDLLDTPDDSRGDADARV